MTAISTMTVTYDVTEADIEATRERYGALEATTPAGYEEVRLAIAHCRGTRTAVEKRRRELKADALEWGRKVDGAAKALTSLVESIEEPLQAKKQLVDDERDRRRRAAEEAARREAEAEAKAKLEAEEIRLAVERARLAVERSEWESQQLAARQAQREIDERQERARREIEAARRAIEAEQAASAEAERLRLAAVATVAEEEKRAAEEAARVEALRPDLDKVLRLAAQIRQLEIPLVQTREARARLATARLRLATIAAALEAPPEFWTTMEVPR
jgi:colicin import membrane protein